MNIKTFFITILEKHMTAIEMNIKGVRLNKDSEYITFMREAALRLKVTLWDFQDLLKPKDYERALLHVNKLSHALENAYDMDAKIDRLRLLYAHENALPYRRGIVEIIEELSEDREEIQLKILKTISLVKKKQILKTIAKSKLLLDTQDIALDEWMKSCLITQLDHLFHLEFFVKQPTCVDELHRMRQVSEHLRYTLESLEILYGKRVWVFLDAASKVQQSLDTVCHYDAGLSLMRNLKDSSGRDMRFYQSVRFLLKTFSLYREEAYQDFLKAWAQLKRKKVWAELGFFALDRIPLKKNKKRL